MSERLKILFTINNLKTAGMQNVVADLVRGLDRSKFSPAIAVNETSGSPLETELRKVCSITQLNFRRKERLGLCNLKRIKKEAEKISHSADLVHSFDYVSDAYEGVIAAYAEKPWIMQKTNLSWSDRRWWLRCLCATKIVCLSQAQVKVMNKWRRKLAHIPTGVDVERFSTAQPIPRSRYALTDNHIVLISLAHLVPVKGHLELIQAMASLNELFPQLRLLLVGDGEESYVNELKYLVNKLGLDQKVIFERSAENIPGLLKMCDGKILATRNEGRRESFGAAIVEAMAAGLPVIATKSGGPEEIVIHNKTGWLVEAKGHAPLVTSIREFCRDKGKRIEFGSNGLLRAKELYSNKLMIRRYENLYDQLLT